jgi:hypothetical protein
MRLPEILKNQVVYNWIKRNRRHKNQIAYDAGSTTRMDCGKWAITGSQLGRAERSREKEGEIHWVQEWGTRPDGLLGS